MSSLRAGRWVFVLTALVSFAAFSQDRVQACAACHGADGNSVSAGIPSLAAQPKTFLETQMVLFREELRPSPVMTPLMKGIPDKDIVQLAEHFAKLPAKSAQDSTDKTLFGRGSAIAKKMRCGICHLANFAGQNQIPRLAGQREDYLVAQMRAYRDNQRVGADTTMLEVMRGMPEGDITALGHFLSHSR